MSQSAAAADRVETYVTVTLAQPPASSASQNNAAAAAAAAHGASAPRFICSSFASHVDGSSSAGMTSTTISGLQNAVALDAKVHLASFADSSSSYPSSAPQICAPGTTSESAGCMLSAMR